MQEQILKDWKDIAAKLEATPENGKNYQFGGGY